MPTIDNLVVLASVLQVKIDDLLIVNQGQQDQKIPCLVYDQICSSADESYDEPCVHGPHVSSSKDTDTGHSGLR